MNTTIFPTKIEDLTNGWLTDVLHKNNVPEDVFVSVFSIGPVGAPGQTSNVVRINLEYNKQSSEAPLSLIGKFPATYEPARQMAVSLDTYLREVNFFKFIAPSAKHMVPRCYVAEIDLKTHDFVLLLEDLEGLRMGELFISNPEDSLVMLENIAPFHAYWWDHPDLDTFDWIHKPGKESFKKWIDQLKAFFAAILPLVKQQYERYMSPNAWGVLEKWLDVWDELFDFTPGPYTICHGDYHYLQGFFPSKGNERFAVIDWQVLCVNSSAMDVARLLLIKPEDRLGHEKHIVGRYYELLLQYGVKDYSLDQLWEDIRLNALWTAYIYILAIAQTDNEIFKAYAEKKGVDPYEVALGWVGNGLEDWDVNSAIDRYLTRARESKK
jgi:hypothetical protein